MTLALVVFAAICGLGLTIAFPAIACVLWILALETSPDSWLDNLIGEHETIIGVMKAFGLVLVAVFGLRFGAKTDRWNPGFAFLVMFAIGLIHGLWPGLSPLSSLRSLIGSAGPFLFGFVRLPRGLIRAVQRAVTLGPLFTVGFGGLLAISGLDHMYVVEEGALRLGASGEPPFLAGFALIGVYAGLFSHLDRPHRGEAFMLLLNIIIILLTGARTPLALALLVTASVLLIQRQILLLAAAGATVSLGFIFFSTLGFLRVMSLAQSGQGENLSNRNLVWPYFEHAIATSPLFGWGVGAGKVVISLNAHLTSLIGTNAAHNEYLRIGAEGGILGLLLLITLIALWAARGTASLPAQKRWLMRIIFLGFALHSATDNTLIATTSSVFFIWVSTVFATAAEPDRPAA